MAAAPSLSELWAQKTLFQGPLPQALPLDPLSEANELLNNAGPFTTLDKVDKVWNQVNDLLQKEPCLAIIQTTLEVLKAHIAHFAGRIPCYLPLDLCYTARTLSTKANNVAPLPEGSISEVSSHCYGDTSFVLKRVKPPYPHALHREFLIHASLPPLENPPVTTWSARWINSKVNPSLYLNGNLVMPNGGKDLLTYYAEEPSMEDLLLIAKSIFQGLQYLHQQGIVHKDIKAENIVVKKDETSLTAKITDLGCASIKNSTLQSPEGTTYNHPPEYYTKGKIHPKTGELSVSCSPETDIWGAGCTLAEALTDENLQLLLCMTKAPNLPNLNELVKFFHQEDLQTKVHECVDLSANSCYLKGNQDLERFTTLVKECLTVDPQKRPSAEDFLKKYFPEPDENLLKLPLKRMKSLQLNST